MFCCIATNSSNASDAPPERDRQLRTRSAAGKGNTNTQSSLTHTYSRAALTYAILNKLMNSTASVEEEECAAELNNLFVIFLLF